MKNLCSPVSWALVFALSFSGVGAFADPGEPSCDRPHGQVKVASLLKDQSPCLNESCSQMGVKAWRPEESQQVDLIFSDLTNHYPVFFASLKEKGFQGVYRATTYVTASPDGLIRQDLQGGVFDSEHKAVFLFDWLFRNFLGKDPETMAWVMLHEMAHAFDSLQGHLARQDAFLRAAGWVKDSQGRMVLSGLPTDIDWRQVAQLRGDALLGGRFDEVAALDQKYAYPLGYPSIYAMTKPKEAFAEFAAAFRFDRNWKSYSRPEVDQYFRGIMK